MAAASDEFKVLNPYEIFIGKIIQEIPNREVKVWKAVLLDKVPLQALEKINVDEEFASAEIFSELRKYLLISRNNLELLKDLLKLTHNQALLTVVKDFEKSVKVVKDAPVDQITMISQDAAFVELYLVISCKKENLSPTKITELKNAIEKITVLKSPKHDCYQHLDIFFQKASENESDTDTTVVVFHFPKDREEFITEKIHQCALSKDKWLVGNGVIQLKVNGKSSINLKESLEFKAKDVEDDFYLARKPELQPPAKNVVDIVLVVEMPNSVTAFACQEVIEICHSAFQDITATSELDINLSIIQYGNQTDSTSDHVHVLQDFSKEFDVKSKLKEIGQCGSEGEGNSGMADALARVAELAQSSPSARSNASKVCILVTFPSKPKKGLEHYRSYHGNDIFKTTKLLAKYKMSLYIFGADDKKASPSDPGRLHVEELFLSGVAHFGGGKYFGISAFGSKLLNDVVRHNVSIENHEEKLGEVVRNAIKNHFGDTNENILAGDVVRDPQFTPSMFVPLLQNGRSLEPLKQAAKRIALSGDLDDAIEALARIKKKEQEARSAITRGAPLMAQYLLTDPDVFHCSRPCFASEAKATTTMKNPTEKQQNAKVDAENLPKELQEKVVLDDGKRTPDLEMATRIVRRHFYRMAYCKKK